VATVLITGSNRGIGLELCRQYHARGDDVIATCRSTSTELENLGVRVIDNIDVTQGDDVARLADEIAGVKLDVIVNNAGILRSDTIDSVDFEHMLEQYCVNTLGPLRVTRALRDNLRDGSKVGIITSRVGSIEDNGSGNNYGYRASKAAANMVGMNLRHDLGSGGVAVALLHPGLVATDMTGGRGITAESAASGLIARMDDLNLENTGGFWHAEGYPLPW
jgi:NAD(P)-dependent dehydrogenase (short-subunit alcohol dehydrogenase family)